MYDLQFTATDDADWAQSVEIIDATTNLALADAATAAFELDVTDCGTVRLTAKTSDLTMTKPDANTIQWVFTQAQMSGLCVGTTYKLGCRMTPVGGSSILLFTGTLAFIDGGMA